MFAVIVDWDTPFAIVVLEHQRIIDADPGAPFFCQVCTAHEPDRLPRSVKASLYVVAIANINLPGRRGCASPLGITTSRGACRAARATVFRSRRPLGVRALAEFRFAAAFQATSAQSENC